MDNNESKRIIEAALFTSPGSVSMRDLAKITNSNVAEVRVLVNELTHDYEAKNTSLEIRNDAEGARMAIKEEYEEHVSHMAASPELHKGIMKTLAYIAYKQPVKQAEVINYRNSKAYEHIKLLKEKGFIKKEKKGITYIISTTSKFKEYFGKDSKSSGSGTKIEIPNIEEAEEDNDEEN
ncbi:MAG: SMC-Scp complex subunit ScpB [archaeon]|nr:SMC-Scp complex subunit ScpB [archaeon]